MLCFHWPLTMILFFMNASSICHLWIWYRLQTIREAQFGDARLKLLREKSIATSSLLIIFPGKICLPDELFHPAVPWYHTILGHLGHLEHQTIIFCCRNSVSADHSNTFLTTFKNPMTIIGVFLEDFGIHMLRFSSHSNKWHDRKHQQAMATNKSIASTNNGKCINCHSTIQIFDRDYTANSPFLSIHSSLCDFGEVLLLSKGFLSLLTFKSLRLRWGFTPFRKVSSPFLHFCREVFLLWKFPLLQYFTPVRLFLKKDRWGFIFSLFLFYYMQHASVRFTFFLRFLSLFPFPFHSIRSMNLGGRMRYPTPLHVLRHPSGIPCGTQPSFSLRELCPLSPLLILS